MILEEDSYLAHYGTPRRSGRYPWGSGGQHDTSKSFLDAVERHRKVDRMTDPEIAVAYGMVDKFGRPSTTKLRALKSIAKAEHKQSQIGMAERLRAKGYSNIAIGERMGLNESSVRALLTPGERDKADVLQVTSEMLKQQVAEKTYLGIGVGNERHMGISKEKLSTAVAMLEAQGYGVHYVKVPQLGTGKETTLKVLTAPNTTYSTVFRNRDKIREAGVVSEDGGRSFEGFQPPLSIPTRRVAVRYADEGGAQADGVIYVRPGVKDVSLGKARYAQVRIAVGGTHYLKGMAMYKDDLPDGVDLMFNTNKHDTGNKLDAMKKMSDDADSPFGAMVRQIKDPKTKKVSSSMNIVNEEGDWDTWSKSLSSQFLSKQSPKLARQQLTMVQERRTKELEEINKLTNPAVRKKLLEEFADGTDAAAVKLDAAHLPRQANRVILPFNSLKDTEVYAPGFRNGERVILVRHPHGGIFELPALTVNNRHPAAKKVLGDAPDAIGINSKVAQHLSGADFDGDTVLVIPDRGAIKIKSPLHDLKNFDPQHEYPAYHGMKTMGGGTWNAHTKKDEYPPGRGPSGSIKAAQMGDVSNLITDMTIRGANDAELARAVRHSMVVIDAEKHGLNYRQSALDNGIAALKTKYQKSARAGASTIVSLASSELRVPERKQGFKLGPTGEKVFTPTGATFVNAKGKTVSKTTKTTKLAEARDAHTLSSGTPIEKIYADHSNALKSLANKARLDAARTKSTPYSSSAKTTYAKEVASLNGKLNIALRNAPLERQAQVVGNAIVAEKRRSNPDMDKATLKKVRAQALEEARIRTGAKKIRVDITSSEWQAIQAGAVSNHKLTLILNNADMDVVRQLATPRTTVLMTGAKQQRATSMLASGYTQSEVADALGVSLTTLKDSLS